VREDRFAPLSALTLERYRLRELPAAELARLDARLGQDPALREALARLEASDLETLGALKPADFVRRLEIRAEARNRREKVFAESAPRKPARAGETFWKPMLAGFAAVALIALPVGFAVRNALQPSRLASAPLEDDTVRLKGLEPHLAIFRKTPEGAEPLASGEKARPGEFLRIGYQAGGFSYGAILSVDGNGSVTRHWPAQGARAAKLEKGEALLPQAFELDAAPDYERFYFVVSKHAFDLDPVLSSLRDGESAPSAPQQAKVVRFDVLKDTGI
jgi:hypothetical protein